MTNAPDSTAKLHWTLGDRLYKSLRLADVSNKEMASVLGVSPNTVGNYIADRTPIKDGALKAWAMRTGVSFEELRYGSVTISPDGGGGASASEIKNGFIRSKVRRLVSLKDAA